MEIRGRAAERRSAAAARVKRGLSWKAWAADLDEHLDRIDKLMWPNLMILGGGVSKNADKFIPRLTTRCRSCPAALRNDAGIIGAAIVAAEAPADAGASLRPPRRRRAEPRPARMRLSGVTDRRPPTSPLPDEARLDRRRDASADASPTSPRWSSAARPSTPPTDRRSTSSTRRPARSSRRPRWAAARTSTGPSAAAQKAFEDRKGWANWAAGKRGRSLAKLAALIKEHTEELAQLESRNVGKPIIGRARRDHRRQPRLRLLRRRRQQDLRPDDPGLEAGARHDAARADRGRRADRAVELPAPDGLVEGRAGARRGQHRDPQARQLLAVDGDPARRAGARGRHPGRRPQRRDRAGRLGRRVDRGPPGHRQGRLHRRDHDRPGDHAAGRRAT